MIEPGGRIGPYRIEGNLGRGGMAVVYRAVHARDGSVVALKVCAGVRGDPTLAARFSRELQIHSSLTHPNLVHVSDSGIDGDQLYVALELVDGGTLEDLLRQRGPLPLEAALGAAKAVASALEYLHDQQIVHRDVKPSNVLLTRSGRTLVADLGLAFAQARTRMTLAGQLLGTLPFLAPELVNEIDPSPAQDIYALGVTLFRVLTGEYPVRYSGVAEWVREAGRTPFPTLAEKGVSAPGALDELLGGMAFPDPAARPTAREARMRLEGALADVSGQGRAGPRGATQAVHSYMASQPGSEPPEADSGGSDDGVLRIDHTINMPPLPPVAPFDQPTVDQVLGPVKRIYRAAATAQAGDTVAFHRPPQQGPPAVPQHVVDVRADARAIRRADVMEALARVREEPAAAERPATAQPGPRRAPLAPPDGLVVAPKSRRDDAMAVVGFAVILVSLVGGAQLAKLTDTSQRGYPPIVMASRPSAHPPEHGTTKGGSSGPASVHPPIRGVECGPPEPSAILKEGGPLRPPRPPASGATAVPTGQQVLRDSRPTLVSHSAYARLVRPRALAAVSPSYAAPIPIAVPDAASVASSRELAARTAACEQRARGIIQEKPDRQLVLLSEFLAFEWGPVALVEALIAVNGLARLDPTALAYVLHELADHARTHPDDSAGPIGYGTMWQLCMAVSNNKAIELLPEKDRRTLLAASSRFWHSIWNTPGVSETATSPMEVGPWCKTPNQVAFGRGEFYFERGRDQMNSGDPTYAASFTEAMRHFGECSAGGYLVARSLHFIGASRMYRGDEGLGDAKLALRDLQRSMEMRSDPTTHLDLGKLHALNGNNPDEIAEFERALAMQPNWAECHFLLALAYDRSGRSDTARIVFKHAKASILLDDSYKDRFQELLKNSPTSQRIAAIVSEIIEKTENDELPDEETARYARLFGEMLSAKTLEVDTLKNREKTRQLMNSPQAKEFPENSHRKKSVAGGSVPPGR